MPVVDADLRGAVRRMRRTLDDAGAALVGRRIVALCSGGIDSVVLVALLARLPRGAAPRTVTVLWLDHGVRADVEAECAAARRAATAADFDFVMERGAVRGDATAGTQADARAWRYATAARVARSRGCDVVVTGHTASDQLEGALLGLVGVTAAGTPTSMPVTRELAPGVRLVRPLLGLDRVAVADVARAAALTWVDDPSNDDPDAYVRNAVRHRVVPSLLAVAPGAGLALARAADRATTSQAALDALAVALLDSWRTTAAPQHEEALDVRLLAPLETAARHAVIACWLRSAGVGRALDTRTIRAVDELVLRRDDAGLDLADHACVRRAGYHVTLDSPDPGAPRP